jgi:hypothetical protein
VVLSKAKKSGFGHFARFEKSMIQDKTASSSSVQSCETAESRPGVVKFYLQCKRLFVFQLKLYIDAFRDVVLSALSFFAFLFDVVLMRDPQSGYFEKVLAMGRRSERLINLFEQHIRAGQQADSVGRSEAKPKPESER